MRRVGNLYDRIADPDNLRLAFWKASRGKRHKPDAARFRAHLGDALADLRRELLAGQVRLGDYHYFTIHDPKERTICAAPFRERVLHHAVMNLCEPVFEAYQIHASYACRPGKGVHAAVARAQRHAAAHPWYVKLDVRHYFASIDHGVLLGRLARRFKDTRLLDLFGQIVASYATAPGKGVPIGNLTSQYFANHYLAVLDHFVKERLGVRSYLRYMDDLLLWGDDREQLKGWRDAVEAFTAEPLQLELRPPVLGRSADGLTALGYRVFPHGVRLAARSKRRFARKLCALERGMAQGTLGEAEAALRAEPLVAFTRHAAARGFRQAVLRGREEVGRAASGARTGSSGAEAGTTTRSTRGLRTATTTGPTIATTTSASAWP